MEVKLVIKGNKNLAASRNIVLPHSKGEIVVMTNDAEVFPDWLVEMKRAHSEDSQVGAVGGPVIGAEASSPISRIFDQVTIIAPQDAGPTRNSPGGNVSNMP